MNASLGDVLVEVKDGIGPDWAKYPVLGATRAGVAPARESPGKHAERYKLVTPGTVFYNPMRILIGSIAFVDDDDEWGITSPDYVVLKGKPGVVDSRWFYYWLRSPWGERCIQSLARGAVRERMLFSRLAEGEIDLPDYKTQVKASKALAVIRPLRCTVRKQLSELVRLPQKLLGQVYDKIENAGKFIRIGDVAETSGGSTPSRDRSDYWIQSDTDGLPWVRTAEIAFEPITTTREKVSAIALRECSLAVGPPGTVLIAMFGEGKTRGQSALLQIEATFNQACFAIFPNETFDSEYLQLWLMSQYQELRRLAIGRGGSQANLNGSILKDLRVPWIKRNRQEEVVASINAQRAAINMAHQAARTQLSELDVLPHKLLAQVFGN